MNTLKITSEQNESYTTVSNLFIDEYMAKAQGDYVKIYLYLLRLMQGGKQASISDIADHFDITEKDLCRAFKYWIKEEVLRLVYDGKLLVGITLLPLHSGEGMETIHNDPFANMAEFQHAQDARKRSANATMPETPAVHEVAGASAISSASAAPEASAVSRASSAPEASALSRASTALEASALSGASAIPEVPGIPDIPEALVIPKKRELTAKALADLASNTEFSQLLYLLETYLGKTITQSESRTLAYIYDDLEFSTELLEYLIEYCVMNNKKSVRYMEKVAINWYTEGITDVETAKEATLNYNTIYSSVLKALGIVRRTATNLEISYINTWHRQMGFDTPIIIEACRRAMILKPKDANFPYVNGILENWHKENVHTLAEINKLDQEFYNSRKKVARTSAAVKGSIEENKERNSKSNNELDELTQLFMEDVSNAVS